MTLAAPPRKGHAERAWHALRTDPWTLVALAALAFLAVFVVLPLFELLRQSVMGQESGRFGLENFVTFFESRYFRRALGNSFLVATLGTVLALMIGLPLAFVFARYDFPAKRWIEVAILMSMLSPPFVGAYAWILMFGRSGLVTEAGRSIGLELPTIYGPVGIAIASAFGLYPLVFLVVRGALSRVSATIEEAAASLGRSPIYVLWSVTLPLVMPAVVTSALLVFLGIISDFGTPAILGEGERYPVLATLAFSLYLSEIGAETGMAATTSMILVGLALALVLAAKVGGAARAAGTDPYRETRRRMAVSSPDLRLRPDRHGLPPCPLRTIPFMITPMITPMCLRSPGSAASHGPAHSMHPPSSAQSATCCGPAG